jgi:cytochrome c oxidase subunit 3
MSSDTHTLPGITSSGLKQPYHLVDPSPWPIIGAVGGAATLAGIAVAAHTHNYLVIGAGLLITVAVMFFWWRDVIKESRTPGMHSPIVQLGLRYGMMLFIASEVMFFVGFFWAYFHFAFFPEHVLNATAHPVWPPANIETFPPFRLPFLNTMILLLSGTTVTWAHHSLLEGDRKGMLWGLGCTVALGLSFTCCQAIEYSDAPFHFNGGGIYPSVFFLATGFHGWFRAKDNQFTPARHFGLEAAAWYWHFVDVVWLFLFICIYYFGQSAVTAG